MAQGILHARETPDAVNSAPNPAEAVPHCPDSPRLESRRAEGGGAAAGRTGPGPGAAGAGMAGPLKLKLKLKLRPRAAAAAAAPPDDSEPVRAREPPGAPEPPAPGT